MQTHRSRKLVVVEVRWEQKPGKGWLLRQVFDLLLRDPAIPPAATGPDLTDGDTPLTMQPSTVADDKGGER